MRATVTEKGVTIPKHLLGDAREVEIREEVGRVVVEPISERDPILDLGTEPVVVGAHDASVGHDRYIYGQSL
jgi:virulence-associated protein VagC